MSIRPATLQDRQAIFKLALECSELYPMLKPDRSKIQELITDSISSAKHFCWVTEGNDKVSGVLIGLTGNNLWAQRQFCSITLWVSKIPGAGADLLRTFKHWVISRPAIRVAGIAPDVDLDLRIWKLMQRCGFNQQGGAFLLYNRGYRHGSV